MGTALTDSKDQNELGTSQTFRQTKLIALNMGQGLKKDKWTLA